MMKIGFLGLGKMGVPMVRRLLGAGHSVVIWNRSRERAEELVPEGATVASSAVDAVRGQDAVLSSLKDDASHEEVFFGAGGVMGALAPGQLHVSLSTLSVALSKRFTEEHARRGQRFVGAPVFGRPNVAADGRLWVAAAGADEDVNAARPALEPLARGITVVGAEPWQAHALKLGGNFMIASMIQTMSEAFVFAESQDIDPQVFFATVNAALFQSAFYEAYAKVMFQPLAQPGATIQLGAKDTRLFREAGSAAGFDSGLAAYLAAELQRAIEAGLGEADWPTSTYRVTRQLGRRQSGDTSSEDVG
jgi:3-hydroxyisobutyrate dehydrogenase-like beta-hydroxyacid dehydrogenase